LEVLAINFNLIHELEILGYIKFLFELELFLAFGTTDCGMGPPVYLEQAGLAESMPTWKG
jgi:hypothetical protein